MEAIVWKGFLCDVYDLFEFLDGKKSWDAVRKKETSFLVDTGASMTVIPEKLLEGLSFISLGTTMAQGICKEPVKFRRILIGIAIPADGISASPHEVLVPIDKTVEEKLVESLKEINASALLGRYSLDAPCLRIDLHTKAPIKVRIHLL